MYPGDSRAKWPSTLLTGPHVTQYWDQPRALGTLYLSNLPAMFDRRADGTLTPAADAMWDAFYVYGRNDQWDGPVPTPAVWGYPIMPTREHLAQALEALNVP